MHCQVLSTCRIDADGEKCPCQQYCSKPQYDYKPLLTTARILRVKADLMQPAVFFQQKHSKHSRPQNHKASRPKAEWNRSICRQTMIFYNQLAIASCGSISRGVRRLDADMQRHQRIVHRLAHRQQFRAASHHLGIGTLGKIHLIFDHFHHGLARRKHVDIRKAVLRKNLRDIFCFTPQRMIIGTGGTPDVDPRCIVILQQLCVSFRKSISLLHIGVQRKPPRQEITA